MSERASIAMDFAAAPAAGASARATPECGVTEPSAQLATDRVRPCTPSDLHQVARLFQIVFRKHASQPPPDLIEHLEEVYFRHPWRDAELPSLVLEREDGSLDGFIGIIPLQLMFRGEKLRGSVAGAFMVKDPEARPLAAARLMRSHVAGSQDVSFGDTTNGPAQTMWERLGGHLLPLASMEWLKVIRWAPFGAASAISRLPRPLDGLLRPAASALEMIGRPFASRTTPVHKDWDAASVDDDRYLDAVDQVSASFALRLLPDRTAGRWLLRMAAKKRRYGTLFKRVVTNRAGKSIGCYLIYCQAGQPAETLQIIAAKRSAHAVLASIVAFATAQRCTAVRGRTQGPYTDAFFRAGCLMRHRSATVVHTANAELLSALESGHVALGGFFGETWTRLVSDDFGDGGRGGRA